MAEGIISASATPPPTTDEQARFDTALANLLDDQYRDLPPSTSPGVGYAPGYNEPEPPAEPAQAEPGLTGPSEPPPVEAPATGAPGGAGSPPAGTPPPDRGDAGTGAGTVGGEPPAAGEGDRALRSPALGTTPQPAAGDGPPPEPLATPEPAATPGPEPADLERIFTAYLGSVPTAAATVQLLNFVSEVQALPPERQAVIQRALDGDPTLLAQLAAPRTAQPPAQPAPAPDPWGTTDTPPAADPRVDALQAQLDAMAANQAAREKADYDRWVAYERDATKGAAVSYAQAKGLDSTDLAILEARTQQNSNYGAMLRANGNDPAAAYTAALDMAYWSVPTFRSREMPQHPAPTPATQGADQDRQALASAVSASSSAGTAPLPPAGPRTLEEAKAAAMGELRAVFDIG